MKLLEWVLLAVGVAGVALWLRPAADRMLTWDEIHYIQAAREGWWPNALDRGSMSPVNFVRFSLAKARGQDTRPLAEEVGYREDADMLASRHWHPPLALAPALAGVRLADAEPAARWSQVAWVAAVGALLLVLLGIVLPDRPGLRVAGLALFFLDPILRTAALELHIHLATGAALLLLVLALTRLAGRDDPGARDYGLVGVATGVLLVVFSAASVFLALLLAGLLLTPAVRPRLLDRRTLTVSLPAVVGTVLVLWPAGVLKAGLAKIVALRAYSALFLGGQEWSSAGSQLMNAFTRHPVLGGYLVALAVGAVLAVRGKLSPRGQAVATTGLVYALLLLPFSIITRYLFPFVPLAIAASLVLGRALAPKARPWLAALPPALLAGLLLMGQGVERPGPELENARRADLAMVRTAAEAGDRILADGAHVYAFYLDDPAKIHPLIFGPGARSLATRDNVENVPVTPDDYDRLVITAWKEEFPVVKRLRERCREVRTPVTLHFLCSPDAEPDQETP